MLLPTRSQFPSGVYILTANPQHHVPYQHYHGIPVGTEADEDGSGTGRVSQYWGEFRGSRAFVCFEVVMLDHALGNAFMIESVNLFAGDVVFKQCESRSSPALTESKSV
jgi:hypothetical protein